MVDDPSQFFADVHDLSHDRADCLGMVIIFDILRMMIIIKSILKMFENDYHRGIDQHHVLLVGVKISSCLSICGQ